MHFSRKQQADKQLFVGWKFVGDVKIVAAIELPRGKSMLENQTSDLLIENASTRLYHMIRITNTL